MKKIVRFLSVILVVILSLQIINPGVVSALEMNAATKITAEKSASKGKLIDSTDGVADLTEEEASIAGISDNVITKGTLNHVTTPIIGEVKELRSENTKHYRHSDGTYTMVTYSEPIHYQDEAGEWQEVDNTLILNQSGKSAVNTTTYTTVSSAFDIRIPQDFSNNKQITVEKDGYTVGLGIKSADSTMSINNKSANETVAPAEVKAEIHNDYDNEIEEYVNLSELNSLEKIEVENNKKMELHNQTSSVVYRNIFAGSDIEYVISSSKIKENIIINERQNQYTYVFSLSFGDLIPEKQDDGSIYLLKNASDKEPLFVIDAPYMIDAANEISMSVDMVLKNNSLIVTADADWINDENRVFPVVIDPSITLSDNSFKDAYISTASKNVNYNTGLYNYAGTANLGTRRTYMQFSLPALPKGSVVTDAVLAIKQYTPDYGDSSNKIYAFDLTGKASWDATKITWNNQPLSTAVNGPHKDNVKILDYNIYQTENKAYYSFNITNAAKIWYENGTNNGIMVTTKNETDKCHVSLYSARATSSSDRPIFIVSYLNNIGLEDYWSYETIDAGRSGTAYVNDYNGSLTYVHNDLSMTGNRLPISISHVYNSNNESTCNSSYYSGINVGTNFHLNLQEVLTAISSSDSLYSAGYRYIHYDSDGTKNYFKTGKINGATKITHEYDPSMVISTEGSNTVITDSQGNKKYFRSDGKLFKLSDANGNTQTLTFSGNKITAVTDPAGRVVTLSYNSSNQLTSITDPSGRSTTFAYSSSKLTKITYPDGKATTFTYSSNDISRITSVDNSYISLSYISTFGCGNRVGYVYQYDKAGMQTDYLRFQYSETNASGTAVGNTLVTNKNGQYNRYMFDAFGRATEITNKYSQTQYVVYGSNVENMNTFNEVVDQSELQTISTNLVKNHGFERTDYWTALQAKEGTYGYSLEESSNGTRSMKLELPTDTGVIEVDQDFNAVSKGTYTVSLDINIPEKLAATGNSGVFFGFVYCVDGKWATDGSQWFSSTNGWERFSHTITLPSGTISNCHVFIEIARATGKVYFDNIQVERSGGSRYYNLVENSDFSNAPQATTLPTGASAYAWTKSALETNDGVQIMNNLNYFLMAGSPNNKKKISQSVPVNANEGDTLIIGGKAAAYASIDSANSRKFSIIADIYSTETKKIDTIEIPFDRSINMEHQTKATYYTLTTPCHHIVYSFVYYNQIGNAAFDNAFIYVGSYGDHFDYNSNGQLSKESNDEGTSSSYSYKNNDLTHVTQTVSGKEQTVADMEYDGAHNVKKITNNLGTEIEFEYLNGQVLSQTITDLSDDSGKNVATEKYTYIQNGNYVKTFTDANGRVTTYTYDNDDQALIGLVVKVEDPNGNITNYTYDSYTDELISVSGNASPSTSSVVGYTSQDYLPKTLTHNGTVYSYDYDNQNRVIASKIGSQTIMSNTYDGRQRLSKQTYANGSIYTPVYDGRDRLTGEKWNNIQTIKYYYNENDRLSQIEDLTTDTTYQYDYAFYGLLHRILGSDGSKTLYDYDRSGQMSHFTFSVNDDIIYDARFTNNEKGNPDDVIIKSLDNTLLHYNYDGFSRLTGYTCGPVITSIEYEEGSIKTNSTVTKYSLEDFDGNALQQYEYAYDANGNIIRIDESLSGKTTVYNYDGLDRLVSETDGTDTYVYTYDEGGNLTSITKNDTLLHNYTYGNTNWTDQLTAIDGKTITYDLNGNPLTYDGYTYTWQRGNQLSGVSNSTNDIVFNYDSQGHRVQKVVNGTITEYTYSGDLLMRQSDGTNTLDFAYDSSGFIVGFVYNDNAYFYLKNQQGDVVAVADSSGNIVAEYLYDAYGNTISSNGIMADINPIRYRGYYYDSETGLYFLTSRYYNPEWRRFLNADRLFIAGDDVINGINMYAYCYDNPVMYTDSEGTAPVLGMFVYRFYVLPQRISARINNIHYALSQGRDAILGEKIMTPIADLFMDISPVISLIMEIGYIFADYPGAAKNWQDRDYPFRNSSINDFHFLQLRQYFPSNMSILAGIGAAFLDFHRNIDIFSPNFGNYTTLPGSYQWQKSVGYNWWYDWFFNLGGPIGKERFVFDTIDSSSNSGKYYVVWCWKGDYWNLGAGAEIGIYYGNYKRNENDGYYDIDTKLHLKVCMNVDYYKNGFNASPMHLTTDFKQSNWWVTSFTPKVQSPDVTKLKVNLKVAFIDTPDHQNLYKYFYKHGVKMKSDGEWTALTWTNVDGYQFEINY